MEQRGPLRHPRLQPLCGNASSSFSSSSPSPACRGPERSSGPMRVEVSVQLSCRHGTVAVSARTISRRYRSLRQALSATPRRCRGLPPRPLGSAETREAYRRLKREKCLLGVTLVEKIRTHMQKFKRVQYETLLQWDHRSVPQTNQGAASAGCRNPTLAFPGVTLVFIIPLVSTTAGDIRVAALSPPQPSAPALRPWPKPPSRCRYQTASGPSPPGCCGNTPPLLMVPSLVTRGCRVVQAFSVR